MLLTRSPLSPKVQAPSDPVRLACVKHAASVHPEPGSNSPTKTKNKTHQKNSRQKRSNPKRAKPKWFKPENNPAKTNTNNQKTKRSKIISIKKTKNRKNQTTHQKQQATQLNPTQTKQKNTTIENTNNQTTNQPNRPVRVCCEQKISGGFSFPTGFRARQRIQSYRASVRASNQNKQK